MASVFAILVQISMLESRDKKRLRPANPPTIDVRLVSRDRSSSRGRIDIPTSRFRFRNCREQYRFAKRIGYYDADNLFDWPEGARNLTPLRREILWRGRVFGCGVLGVMFAEYVPCLRYLCNCSIFKGDCRWQQDY